MGTDNTNSQLKKGVLELCILSLIKEEEAYASDIIDKMKEAKLLVVEGTLYPLLTRLKNDGMLSYRWEESTQGPPRKYYKITPAGKKYHSDLNQQWQELISSVEQIIK